MRNKRDTNQKKIIHQQDYGMFDVFDNFYGVLVVYNF